MVAVNALVDARVVDEIVLVERVVPVVVEKSVVVKSVVDVFTVLFSAYFILSDSISNPKHKSEPSLTFSPFL